MSECYSSQCQQDRKFLRKEFRKWTRNVLLQVGLETVSKYHYECDINVFYQLDEKRTPIDFDPNEICSFCVNRQMCRSDTQLAHIDEFNKKFNSPAEINPNLYSSYLFSTYYPEDLLRFNHTNSIYASLSSLNSSPGPIVEQSNSSICDRHITKLVKQMVHLRMMEELESQRNAVPNIISHRPILISSESMNVNHILKRVMKKILTPIVNKQQYTDNINIRNQEHCEYKDLHGRPLSSTSSTSSSRSSLVKTRLCKQTREPTKNTKNQVRLKRGHYRHCKSEQLRRAMSAVLHDQMSVPKAVSCFGAPHSTLEYKVKEQLVETSIMTNDTSEMI
ncbi:unnamed protein product [Adineta ricciae]|uniref:HTH psq-type domain-containing protein n=1 Tax=Adineta ricciae TaxID=249248 RepID=A0A813W1A4_ADIRI|nr:unnamed protein product [Adineta ricciae]CAF0848283.1 unnamed protein product [Adineta ricciae]